VPHIGNRFGAGDLIVVLVKVIESDGVYGTAVGIMATREGSDDLTAAFAAVMASAIGWAEVYDHRIIGVGNSSAAGGCGGCGTEVEAAGGDRCLVGYGLHVIEGLLGSGVVSSIAGILGGRNRLFATCREYNGRGSYSEANG